MINILLTCVTAMISTVIGFEILRSCKFVNHGVFGLTTQLVNICTTAHLSMWNSPLLTLEHYYLF